MASVVTFRRRKIFKNLSPLITVTLSDPFYPADYKNKTELRSAVRDFMVGVTEKEKSYGYNTFVKETEIENNNSL